MDKICIYKHKTVVTAMDKRLRDKSKTDGAATDKR